MLGRGWKLRQEKKEGSEDTAFSVYKVPRGGKEEIQEVMRSQMTFRVGDQEPGLSRKGRDDGGERGQFDGEERRWPTQFFAQHTETRKDGVRAC